MSPEAQVEGQVGFDGAVARGKANLEADKKRQEAYPKFDGVGKDGKQISWDEIDAQYMPGQTDRGTVAEKDSTLHEEGTAFNPDYSIPESDLIAFNNTGGSTTARATSEAGLSADSATGALGEGASMMSGESGGDSGGGTTV